MTGTIIQFAEARAERDVPDERPFFAIGELVRALIPDKAQAEAAIEANLTSRLAALQMEIRDTLGLEREAEMFATSLMYAQEAKSLKDCE